MELERLDTWVQRSARAVRRLIRSAPEVPIQTPTEGLGDPIPDQQNPTADDQVTEEPARPTEALSEPENSLAHDTAEQDPNTIAQESTAPNLQAVTHTTNPINLTISATNSQDLEVTSSATSRITNVDSLGFAAGLTSSISSPPSEIVASTDFVGAVIFAQKIIVAPNMRHRIDPELLKAWDKKISDRLWNDLDTLGTGAVVTLEFHMAGENKKKLKPTIIITCDGAKSQKHNIAKMKSLKWLEPYRLRCCVVKNSDKRRFLALTKAKEDSTSLPYEVVANIDDDTCTLCGVTAALKTPALESITPFRLGGLIKVDDEVLCLTAGHVVAPSHSEALSTTSAEAQTSDADSTTEVDDSSLIFNVGEWASDDETEVLSGDIDDEPGSFIHDLETSKSASVLRPSNFHEWSHLGHLDSHFARDEQLKSQPSVSYSDWGLIKLKAGTHDLRNIVRIPGKNSSTIIQDIITEDELSQGQVWAVTEFSRPKSGFLSSGAAYVFLYGKRFRVRQIAFDDALVPGDSGAWVIQNEKLCGYIIAGRPGLKWAYMITIEDVFADIKKALHARDVRLPRASERLYYSRSRERSGQHQNLDAGSHAPNHTILPIPLRSPEAKPVVKSANHGNPFRQATRVDTHSGPLSPSSSNLFSGTTILDQEPQQTPHEPDIPYREPKRTDLDLGPRLNRSKILLIAMGGLIGTNIYANNGKALKTAGPAGAMIAYAVVGLITIMVMECITEMAQLFTNGNTIINSVKELVDPDLAWLVGIAHWYTYSIALASLSLSAADLSTYWELSEALKAPVFFLAMPIVVLMTNLLSRRFSIPILAYGGLLKLYILIGCIITMIVAAARGGVQARYIGQGFQHDDAVAANPFAGVLYCVPFIAYGFIGVETVAIMNAQARIHHHNIAMIPHWLSYVAFLVVFILAVVEFFNVGWEDDRLPGPWFQYAETSQSTVLSVLAAKDLTSHVLPGFIVGCLIYTTVSASNTVLCVAARSLYGVLQSLPPSWPPLARLTKYATYTRPSDGIPTIAIFVSAVAFWWLPWASLADGDSVKDLVQALTLSGTISCLLVWAFQCVAFIRYRTAVKRLWISPQYGGMTFHHLMRDSHEYAAKTPLGWLQPLPAYIGLFGCLFMVFACGSSLWWSSSVTAAKILGAFGVPIIGFIIWVLRKAYLWSRYRSPSLLKFFLPVKLDPTKFVEALMNLGAVEYQGYQPEASQMRERSTLSNLRRFVKKDR